MSKSKGAAVTQGIFTTTPPWALQNHIVMWRCKITVLLTFKKTGTMNVFEGMPIYGDSWKVVSSRNFNEEEISFIKKAEVVSSEYGNSVCFFLKAGGQSYIPLSNKSSLNVGDEVDMTKAKLLVLHRDGSGDIKRIDA